MITQSQVVRHTGGEPTYIPVAFRREVLRQGNYVCVFCGKEERHHLCHNLPKCRGGSTVASNLLVCCHDCQKEKDSKTAGEYREVLKWRGVSENVHTETTREPQKIEIHFLDGEILNAETKTLPGKQTEGIIITSEGNGKLIWVNLRGVKKVIFRSAAVEELEIISFP